MNYVAIRTFYRIWGPISDRLELGAEADHQIDAGEWSDSANAKRQQEVYYEYVSKVAHAFGMGVVELDREIEGYNYIQWDMQMQAQVERAVRR